MQLSTQGMKSDVTSDMAKTFKDFIQPHLDRVSRSFALGIGQLDLSLKVPVGLSYLICRMLDTVEDAAWPTGTDQESAFEVFETFLKIKPTEAQVSSWARAFPLDLPEGERRLLGEASRVFQEFHALEPSDRAVILGPVLSMSRGMNHFMSHKRETGSLRLTSMVEVQTYCFFVAGLVGEVLTGLVRERVDGSFPGLTYLRGGHFGLFLQKVNILKDQKSDEAEGRHLVPDRVAVRQSLRLDAREAMNYLDSIPIEQ